MPVKRLHLTGIFFAKKSVQNSIIYRYIVPLPTQKESILDNIKHSGINNKWLFAIVVFVCVIGFGCSENGPHRNIREGSVKYKITYLKTEKESPIIGLLPSTIVMRFNHDKVLLEMEGWLGIFRSAFVKNGDDEVYTLLKILSKKYIYISEPNEGYYGMRKPDNLQVDFDDETKQIIGFNCNHAKISVGDSVSFDVFYTTDLKIKNATANTPLDMIPGMLMDFQLEMNGIPMHLEAIEFINEKVQNSIFDIPNGYERVVRSQMDEIFNGIGK